MSQQHSVLTLSVKATAALTANTFATAAGAVPTANAHALGVAQTAGAIGDEVPVAVLGTSVVTAGGAIAAGAAVQVGASGKAVTGTATPVNVGIALEAATADGDAIEIFLIPNA